MPRKPVERKPMKERIGWAVVNRGGDIVTVNAHGKQEAIRALVDPELEMPVDERREEWAEYRDKHGFRCIKVRISAV